MNIFRTFGGESDKPTLEGKPAKLGEMNFAFIDMGQGDCTMVSLPDNSVLIVDCGSSGGLPDDSFAKAQKLVRSWAKGKAVNVIMTHPDKDHYNKFIDLLVSKPKVEVNMMYFSKALRDKSPLGNYKETALGANIYHFGRPVLVEVTLNSDDNFIKKWLPMFKYEDSIQSDIPSTGYVIKEGLLDNGERWSVTIIAGNVDKSTKVSAAASNVVSICTLFSMGTSKLLLTGDSTVDTLAYLYSNQKPRIKNVSIFQVPHHGSDSSLPTDQFKTHVNPETLLVSVAVLNTSFFLPKLSVMQAWLACKRLRKASWQYEYWTWDVKGYNNFQDLKNIIAVKWKNYEYRQNDSGTFFWLKYFDDAKKSGTGFYGFSNRGSFLYRVPTDKDLYLTGVNGSMFDEGFIED